MKSITIIAIIIFSIFLWVLYYEVFNIQPEKAETVIIVGFAALCVLGARAVLIRLSKKEKKS